MIDLSIYEIEPLVAMVPWEAIAIGASALIGGVVSWFSSKSTNDSNKELMEQQNEFNKQMVQEQNEYNSPSAQKSRIEAAGLNPSFFFGNNGLDNIQSSPAQGASIPSLTAPNIDTGSFSNAFLNAKRVQNETLTATTNAEKSIQESISYKIANSQLEEQLKLQRDAIKNDSSLKESEREYKLQQLETEKLRQQEVFYNAENLKYQLNVLRERANSEHWNAEKLKAETSRIIQLTPFEASNLAASANLSNEHAKVASESLNKIQQEVVNLVKQGKQIDAVTLSQVIDNEVKNIKANNDISSQLLLSDSPILNCIYQNTNGMIGDLVKTIGAFTAGGTSNDSKKSHRAKVNYQRSGSSSWLFGK